MTILRKPARSSQRSTFEYTLPGDERKVHILAWGISALTSLRDYPALLTKEEIEEQAHGGCEQLLEQLKEHAEPQPLTNNIDRFKELFVPAYGQNYLKNIALFQENEQEFLRKKQFCSAVGSTCALLRMMREAARIYQ